MSKLVSSKSSLPYYLQLTTGAQLLLELCCAYENLLRLLHLLLLQPAQLLLKCHHVVLYRVQGTVYLVR